MQLYNNDKPGPKPWQSACSEPSHLYGAHLYEAIPPRSMEVFPARANSPASYYTPAKNRYFSSLTISCSYVRNELFLMFPFVRFHSDCEGVSGEVWSTCRHPTLSPTVRWALPTACTSQPEQIGELQRRSCQLQLRPTTPP